MVTNAPSRHHTWNLVTVSVTYLVCLGLGPLGGLSLGDPAVGGPLQLGGSRTSHWLDNTTFQLSVNTTIQLSSDHTRPSAITAFHQSLDSTFQLPDDCFHVILISPSHGVAFLSFAVWQPVNFTAFSRYCSNTRHLYFFKLD